MSLTELCGHELYSEEIAALFLQADALSAYLSNTDLARMLQAFGLPKKGSGRWDYDAIRLCRRSFTTSDLYNQHLDLNPEYRHFLSIEASKNDRLLVDFCQFLPKLKQTPSVEKEWQYLSLYVNVFPRGVRAPVFNNTKLKGVVRDRLSNVDFDLEWFNSRNQDIKKCLSKVSFENILYDGKLFRGAGTVFQAMENASQINLDELFSYSMVRLLQAKPWRCQCTNRLSGDVATQLDILEMFLQGKYDVCYEELLKIAKSWCHDHKLRKVKFFPGILGVTFYICRYRLNIDMKTFFEDCKTILESIGSNREYLTYDAFQYIYLNKYYPDELESNRPCFGSMPLEMTTSIFGRFVCYLGALVVNEEGWLKNCLAERDVYRCCPVAFNILNDIVRAAGLSDEPNMDVQYLPWIDLARGVPRWEKQLRQLKQIFGETEPGEKKRRLVWLVNFDHYDIHPYVQVLGASGKWSQGQRCSWNKFSDKSLRWITEQDHDVHDAMGDIFSFYSHFNMYFNLGKAIPKLAGHPLIFDMETREPLTLELRKVPLDIKEVNSECHISLRIHPEIENLYLEEDSPGNWVAYQFNDTLKSLDEILGDQGMILPIEELPGFLNVLQGVKDLQLDVKAKTPRLPGHPEPVVQLWQQGSQFLAQVRVRPSGEDKDGTLYIPGDGKSDVLQVHEGKTVTFVRDLQKEVDLSQQLIASCPSLSALDETWSWAVNDLASFFELISELQGTQVPLRIEWPEGEKFKLLGKVSSNQISLHTRQRGDWFSLSGEVQVNELKVLELSDLLERTNGKSRFVELKNGEFLQLSDDIRRSLARLRLFTSRRAGKERQVHPLAGALVQELCEDMQHDSDVSWNEMVTRMRKAFELKPELPASLQAELRPYQMTGFVWLCRLSEWGVGGCLADDMGLGKTIQAIAVMLREAQHGPCLIIAPTSVCPNWVDELHRFAPSLQVVRLRDADDRKEMVESMQKGMVMVTGYGLLPREHEILSTQQWQMVVFDEAQALKNSTTQRSRAAHKINAHFHLALTGTPIENHLEDLWSVFDIINPGLLGTLHDFHRRFGDASEGGPSAAALKMLIRPFILRRLKSQVLDDLPELTEQTIIIEPTEKEATFYESIRRNAIKHVSDGPQATGQRRFSILTELTRLRRACCHASLADPQGGKFVEPVSSKLSRFLELLDEARSGGHRLLVFSQFTGHLALVRAELDKAKIPYQYLDGSTPEEKRRQSVAAFQRGEGDLFLISLKAGGQGLNLTAADYVVHLDPWWNPAVEDQATDRAHRIGQKNTVTVYRLVMAHSVEEKILNLHTRKRDLAADFLEGSEEAVTSATLSEEELLALLQ
ncbi:MAG: DEAD/DEAH box helicase [Desulfovibrio sp.]|nr:DEAD/DEAH box helicase [Desulfovibrio sp.]